MPCWQSSKSEAASIKEEFLFPSIQLPHHTSCVPLWLSAGKRIPGHKSFPNSHYLLFKLNREAACAIFTKIQWPSTNICHSRLSSSHSAPGSLTQHSQPPAATGTLPSPVNLQTLHLPPAQAVTPSQWQTGRDLPLHLACFLADYKKGSQQRHFSSFAEFCTTLQLPIKLWRLLWLTLALLFLLPVLEIAKGLWRRCHYKKWIFHNSLSPLVCQSNKLCCISRNLFTLKQEHQPSRPITGGSYQVPTPSFLFLSTRVKDCIANSTKQAFQSVLQQRLFLLAALLLQWGTGAVAQAVALYFYPSYSHWGQERSTMQVPWGHSMNTNKEHCRASSPSTKLLPDSLAQGPQKPPTSQAQRVQILDINFLEVQRVQACRVRSNPTQRNIYFVSKLKSHCSELH